jgi:hypothetical protein
VLFGDSDMVEIKSISQSILHQEFSDGMGKVLVNDIALFIFNDYVKYNLEDSDRLRQYNEGSDASDGPEAVGEQDTLEKIREEIRDEVVPVQYQEEDLESEDKKIARLKRLAKESGLKGNRGAAVKRVT